MRGERTEARGCRLNGPAFFQSLRLHLTSLLGWLPVDLHFQSLTLLLCDSTFTPRSRLGAPLTPGPHAPERLHALQCSSAGANGDGERPSDAKTLSRASYEISLFRYAVTLTLLVDATAPPRRQTAAPRAARSDLDDNMAQGLLWLLYHTPRVLIFADQLLGTKAADALAGSTTPAAPAGSQIHILWLAEEELTHSPRQRVTYY